MCCGTARAVNATRDRRATGGRAAAGRRRPTRRCEQPEEVESERRRAAADRALVQRPPWLSAAAPLFPHSLTRLAPARASTSLLSPQPARPLQSTPLLNLSTEPTATLALSNSPPTSTRQVRIIPVVPATNCHGVLDPNDPPVPRGQPSPNKCLIKAEFSAARSCYKALPTPDRWPLRFGCPVSPSSRLHLQAIVRDADPTDPLTSSRPLQPPDSFNPTVNRLNRWNLHSQSYRYAGPPAREAIGAPSSSSVGDRVHVSLATSLAPADPRS
jgi:hypothetical protein